MKELKAKADYAGMKALYDQLDPRYHRNRSFQLLNINACRLLSSTAYREALEQYFSDFPEAGNAWLLKMDLYTLQADYTMALQSINKIDSVAGGDPMLDYYRGKVYVSMDSLPQATACFARVFGIEPLFRFNTRQLIERHAAAGNYNKAKQVLAIYLKTEGAVKSLEEDVYALYPEMKN